MIRKRISPNFSTWVALGIAFDNIAVGIEHREIKLIKRKEFIIIKYFFSYQDRGGVNRRILVYHDNLMTVEIFFEKGAIGALHSHHHEQMACILSGAICLEEGKLLDIFTPKREDFL